MCRRCHSCRPDRGCRTLRHRGIPSSNSTSVKASVRRASTFLISGWSSRVDRTRAFPWETPIASYGRARVLSFAAAVRILVDIAAVQDILASNEAPDREGRSLASLLCLLRRPRFPKPFYPILPLPYAFHFESSPSQRRLTFFSFRLSVRTRYRDCCSAGCVGYLERKESQARENWGSPLCTGHGSLSTQPRPGECAVE
jgi:hypothetical protein